MSNAIQDSIKQGFSNNFTKGMMASIDNSTPIFLGNNYDAYDDYELEIQECMSHPILFSFRNDGQHYVPA